MYNMRGLHIGVSRMSRMQHAATHCNSRMPNMQHTATHCNTLQHTYATDPCAGICVLQCVAVCCSALQCVAVCCSILQRVAVCCSGHIIDTCHTCKPNSYCHIPPMCGSSSHTCVTRRLVTRQHTATHCNTLQHTATHCNTLQYTYVL